MIGEPTIDYRLEHIFSYAGRLAVAPGLTDLNSEGVGVDFIHSDGELAGPRIRGVSRSSGTEWTVIRLDGIGDLHAHKMFESHDGVSFGATYQGVIDIGEDEVRMLSNGASPTVAKLRFALRFVAGHPGYRWLERLNCFGIGEYRVTDNAVRYDVYAVHHGRRRVVRPKHELKPLSFSRPSRS